LEETGLPQFYFFGEQGLLKYPEKRSREILEKLPELEVIFMAVYLGLYKKLYYGKEKMFHWNGIFK